MFQKKIDEIFSSMSNVSSIADDILIAGFDEQGKERVTVIPRYAKLPK